VLVALLVGQSVGLVLSVTLLLLSAEARPPDAALGWAVLAGTLGVGGLGCLYLALSRGTMGIVAPLSAVIAATVPAIVGIAGGDRLGSLVIAGMVAALAAVVIITLPDRRLGTPMLPTYHGSRVREGLLIVGAGLGFAGFFLGIDASHAEGGAIWWPLLGVRTAGLTLVTSATLVLVGLRRAPRMRVGPAALAMASLAALGDLGGNLFFLLASGQDERELGVVVVLASLYPVATALLARLVLHERLGRVRLAGVALAVAGVALISLGKVVGG
jgi:drug/metabolite transporter (DMT)-like permease